MSGLGILVVKTTGLPFDRRGTPSREPHFPVSVALAYATPAGWEAWSSVVGITKAVAQRRDLPEALSFAGLKLDDLRGAPTAAQVAPALHGVIAARKIKMLAAWQADFTLLFLGEEPWSIGAQFPRVLDVRAGIGRVAPAGTFATTMPSIAEASAFVAGTLRKGILPPDRTAASMAIQVAHIAYEAQRLAILRRQEASNGH